MSSSPTSALPRSEPPAGLRPLFGPRGPWFSLQTGRPRGLYGVSLLLGSRRAPDGKDAQDAGPARATTLHANLCLYVPFIGTLELVVARRNMPVLPFDEWVRDLTNTTGSR